MDGFTWLVHPASGGSFRCPDAAVEDWTKNGWEPGDPPQEVNPAIAERVAYERARQAATSAAAQTTKTTKAARRGGDQE